MENKNLFRNKMHGITHFPPEISAYINEHFDGGFFSDLKKVSLSSGQIIYQAQICQDNEVYNLRFNEFGKIIDHEAVPQSQLDEY